VRTMTSAIPRAWRTPAVVMICGSVVVLLNFGIKASFGLFLKPMSTDLGWGREIFAFAMALQNLLMGAFMPFTSAVAEKWGSGRVVASGSLIYALGLFIMSEATSPISFYMSGGMLIAVGLSGSGLGLVLGVVSRSVSPERRSWALGIVTAAGSIGQLTMVPVGQAFLSQYGWSRAFFLLGICALVILPMALALTGHTNRASERNEQSLGEALGEARRHSGFLFLTAGFFVCGFHVAFISVHLPAHLTDVGLPATLGAWALSIIGLTNIFGSITSGVLGGKWSKKSLLSYIYSARSATILLFIIGPHYMGKFFGFVPRNTLSVLVFAAIMGILWLSTVPLTSGLVAQIFGPRYMATLFGITYFSHQVGSFAGVWLGGYLFDETGSYLAMWWLAVALGLLAALLHMPIDERTVSRLTAAE